MKSQFESQDYLEKERKIRKDKKKHHQPHRYDDEESTYKAAGKKGHSRHLPDIDDYGFDDDDDYNAYKHLIK